MSYSPKPVDTSKIHLPSDLNDLIEVLAKNTHENWARERMRQGWHWGPKRDDLGKEHPCLIPYDELPESEKKHDRVVAEELLKTITLLGYRIGK
jgi:ryanodine receptor 2